MSKIFISLREDIERGLTLKDIKTAILNIMDDNGYNVDGTIERINKFVLRKRVEIKSIRDIHQIRSKVIFYLTFLCISYIIFQDFGNSTTTTTTTTTLSAVPVIEVIIITINSY